MLTPIVKKAVTMKIPMRCLQTTRCRRPTNGPSIVPLISVHTSSTWFLRVSLSSKWCREVTSGPNSSFRIHARPARLPTLSTPLRRSITRFSQRAGSSPRAIRRKSVSFGRQRTCLIRIDSRTPCSSLRVCRSIRLWM